MNDKPTSGTFVKTLTVIYFSLVMVLVMFSLFVYYQNYSGNTVPTADLEFASVLRYVLVALTPMGIAAGYFVFKQLLGSLPQSAPLSDKLNKYQVAVLIRSACLEAPGLLGGICAMLTGDNSFLLFTGVIVVLFGLLRPTVDSITTDLGLTQQERQVLETPGPGIE